MARVFALVVRCTVKRLLHYSRVGKNRDTSGSPRREPGQPAPPLKVFHFDQKILAVQKPIAYTDLLASVYLFLNFSIAFMKSFVMDSQLIEVLINSFFEFTS